MRLDGLLGEVQDLADLAVGVRLGDELEDLLLARRQRLGGAGGVVGHPLAHERALRRRSSGTARRGDRAHGVDEVVVGLALEHVARRRRPSAPRRGSARRRASRGSGRRSSGAWAWISRVACRPVRCGIATSRIADVGAPRERLGDGLGAVGGLGDDLHVGLAVEQQPQAAADDAVVVGDQELSCGTSAGAARRVVPSPGGRDDAHAPAGEQRALAHARRARGPSSRALGVEAVAVVGDARRACRRPSRSTPTLDATRRPAWRATFDSALLDDAVDDDLLVLAEVIEAAPSGSAGA